MCVDGGAFGGVFHFANEFKIARLVIIVYGLYSKLFFVTAGMLPMIGTEPFEQRIAKTYLSLFSKIALITSPLTLGTTTLSAFSKSSFIKKLRFNFVRVFNIHLILIFWNFRHGSPSMGWRNPANVPTAPQKALLGAP